jgi:hypothetical protein
MAEFKLGRIKFVWKGVWATGSSYYKDDVVSYGGQTFICIAAHTAATYWDTDTANWQLMSGGVNYRSTWSPNTRYAINDVVSLSANLYICVTGHSSQTDLNDDSSKWQIYSAGFSWKNSWTSSTLYRIGDLVSYNADVFICNTRHSSTGSFDATKWDIFCTGLKFEDSFDPARTYVIGDVVTYGGYTYVSKVGSNVNHTPNTASSYWGLLTTGFNVRGTYNAATAYKTGDVVLFGGYSYVAIQDSTGQRPWIGTSGANTAYWNLVVTGVNPKGTWSSATTYAPGDVVEYAATTYVAIAVTLNNTPPDPTHWQLLAQGGTASLTLRGDLAYRSSSGAIVGLHMVDGTVSGSPVKDGYVLKAKTITSPTSALEPRYEEFGYIANVWYVAPSGTDDATNGYGRTIDKPFKTIKYACTQATGPATIFIKTGTYAEQLPITVPTNVSLVGDELRTTIVGPAAGLSDDGITPNNRSRMFMLNSACVVRNVTMVGLTGQFTAIESPTGSGVRRLTTTWPSVTASGAYISLDPAGSITKSPYIQNCSTAGDHAVGCLVDGNLHSSGYKSMVLNDYTQVIDDGIGIWCKGGARVEAVSVFTYYSYIGYLTETGGIIRALNGNNSYGTYGDIATDIDPTDSGFVGTVNNRANQAQFGKMWVGGGKLLAAGITYGGQGYTSASVQLDGAPLNGTNAVASAGIDNGVISHIDVSNAGSSYQYVTGTARLGGTSASGTYLALAATDKAAQNNQYQGMRITVLDGTGAGQTATIKNSILIDAVSGYTKVVYVQKADGSDGWDSISGDGVVTALDASSTYEILPEVKAVILAGHAAPTNTAVLRAQVDIASNTFLGVYILDGGSGYSAIDPPSFTITDPLNVTSATLSAQILDGAIRRLTYTNRGAGYVTMGLASITGNGFAEIKQTGSYINFLGLSTAPRPGNIMTITGQPGNFLVIQTTAFSAGNGAATVQISPSISLSSPLVQSASTTVYQKFSQIRLTGHDYLAIGSGNFASTAYPNVSTLSYIPDNQHKGLNNGRVFYVTTDQDGNLSVGDLFKINQATGQATLNVTAFNLSGLNSLQLGNTGATVYQFSTDSTLSANSDNIVPTQRAIRSYISSQLGSGSNNLQVNVLTAGKIYIQNAVISTSTGTNSDIIITPDGTGKTQLSSVTNYNYTYSQILSQASSVVVNRDYVDNATRTTLHALYVDNDGNLFYTSDIGLVNATVDGSQFVDTFLDNRNDSISISTSGTLQITY